MKIFILKYWLGIALLFTIFYWEFSPLSSINYIQTSLTIILTSLRLPAEMMSNHEIFITKNYVLVIEKACNGTVPYLFFLASILAFPSTLGYKIKWVVIGYILIVFVNIFRIWLVTQFVLDSRDNFSLAHDFLGNLLLIVSALILFVLFVKMRPKPMVLNLKN